jgi:uncharacterized protein (DUF433 family)
MGATGINIREISDKPRSEIFVEEQRAAQPAKTAGRGHGSKVHPTPGYRSPHRTAEFARSDFRGETAPSAFYPASSACTFFPRAVPPSVIRKGRRPPMTKLEQIVRRDPEILGGMPVFVGTRVPIRSLFDDLERGDTLDEFLHQFPSVKREQALALLDLAHQSVSADAPAA